MPSKKPTPSEEKGKTKSKILPTRLPHSLVEDVDAIAKAENMTRSEVIRRAVEAFAFNYKTDQLDQRQLELEKRMKAMESAMRALLVKSIRVSGQSLFFASLPYWKGLPKQKLNQAGFNKLYAESAAWSATFLKSKKGGLTPEEALTLEQELDSGKFLQEGE